MKRDLRYKIFLVVISLLSFCLSPSFNIEADTRNGTDSQEIVIWTCPNHLYITREDYGVCPACGADLIPVSEVEIKSTASERNIDISTETKESDSKYLLYHENYHPDIRLIGRIEYNETKNTPVQARFAGMVTMLYSKPGQYVKAGDRVMRVYDPEIAAIQKELIISKKILDSGSKPIASSSENTKKSLAQVLSTDDSLDTAEVVEVPTVRTRQRTFIERFLGIGETEVPVESMTLNERKEFYDKAVKRAKEWGLDNSQIDEIIKAGTLTSEVYITSPVSGIILAKNFDENTYFNSSDILFIVSDPSSLWFTVEAYEQDLPGIQYGQKVDFTVASYPGKRFSGAIVSIKPTTDDKRRTVTIGVSIDSEQKDLMPGMFTFVKCPTGFIEEEPAAETTE